VLPLAVVLVVGTVFAVLKFGGAGGSADAAGGGPGQTGATSKPHTPGGLYIGDYPYLNACNTFGPAQAEATLGSFGNGGIRVDETYADALPPGADGEDPLYYVDLDSACSLTSGDDSAGAIHSADFTVDQAADPSDIKDRFKDDIAKGQPLSGATGVTVVHEDGGASAAYWYHANAAFELEVVWGSHGTAVPDSTLAKAVQQVETAIKNPGSGKVSTLPTTGVGAAKTPTVDACKAFTYQDYESDTHYAVDPTETERTYGYQETEPAEIGVQTECRRESASESDDIPPPKGTTYLDGGLSPDLEITAFGSTSDAQNSYSLQPISGTPTKVTDLGVPAEFGGDPSLFTLQFIKGDYVVSISDDLTVGTQDWTAAKEQGIFESVAKSVLSKLP
jgi:hypothetical protein